MKKFATEKRNINDPVGKLLKLISDPSFLKFQSMINEPNIFKIIGRTHLERAHSNFWGWLIDPNGSHKLGSFVIQKILLQLIDKSTLPSSKISIGYLKSILPKLYLDDLEVSPNEFNPKEKNITDVGRFDIYATGQSKLDEKNIIILFELKIDSPIRKTQSEKYLNWLFSNFENEITIPIYFLPILGSDSKATVGDDRWFCISYQKLHDSILIPVLNHPDLNKMAKDFIDQYLKTLRTTYKGIKMAITTEERELATSIYEKHAEAIDSLIEILSDNDIIDFGSSELSSSGRGSGKISIEINKNVLEGNSVSDLYRNVLKYLVDEKFINKIVMPWGTGKKRYLITNDREPIHPSGRQFFFTCNL
jgi:hypothetical protein|tara:strand:- start:188 stop:1276 length:1089 start_codon:yes stop_codon:yes gene_type:complete